LLSPKERLRGSIPVIGSGRLKALVRVVQVFFREDVTVSEGTFMIVGLGNPGRRYMRSRHNVGYEVAREFSQRHSIRLRTKKKFRSRIGVAVVASKRVVAVEPTTFMNRSGEAVAFAVSFYGVRPRDLLVIVDDVNLPLGRLRIRTKGSDGGHNGLKSVITWLRTTDFPRLRIGIGGNESRSLTNFVLGDFAKEERTVIGKVVERAADAVDAIIEEGIPAAMNSYNRSGEEPAEGSPLVRENIEETIVGKTNGGPC